MLEAAENERDDAKLAVVQKSYNDSGGANINTSSLNEYQIAALDIHMACRPTERFQKARGRVVQQNKAARKLARVGKKAQRRMIERLKDPPTAKPTSSTSPPVPSEVTQSPHVGKLLF